MLNRTQFVACVFALTATLASGPAAPNALAQVRTYDGGGTDDDWTNPLNWSGDNVPDTTGEDAVINAGGNWVVNFDDRIDIRGLTVGSGDVLNLLNSTLGTELDLSGNLTNNGTININNGDVRLAFFGSNRSINGNGKIVMNGSFSRIDGNNRVTNLATHTIEGRGTVQSITNQGLVQANLNNGTMGVFNSTNEGRFRAINGGTLRLTDTVNQGGSIEADSGTVRIEGTIAKGVVTSLGSGVIEVNGGGFEDLTVTGNVEVELGGLEIEGDIINNASITMISSIADLRLLGNATLDGNGQLVMLDDLNSRITGTSSRTLTNGTNHTIRGGAFVEIDLRNNGLISADRSNQDIRFGSNIDIINRGTIEATGNGSLRLEANFDNLFGLIRSVNNAVVELDGATIEDGILEGTGFRVTDDSSLVSLGIAEDAEIEVRPGHTISLESVAIGDDARIDVRSSGVLSIDGLVENDGRISINSNGTLRGTGILDGVGDGLISQGIIAPGLSVGTLTLTGGSLSLTDTSVLDIELGGTAPGTGHDRLVVNGDVGLDGLLDLSLINAFTPTLGDVFVVLTANAITGTFDSVTGTDLSNGLSLDVVYGLDRVTLEVVAALGLAGDYNDSGSVEQGDLDLVLNNWGGPRTAGFVANADGFTTANVDQEELDRVLNNWGSSSAPAFNGATVPEPATLLLFLGLGCVSTRRRRGVEH